MSYTEAEQFDLPLPGVPPVQEKASPASLIAKARELQRWCRDANANRLIEEFIQIMEEIEQGTIQW